MEIVHSKNSVEAQITAHRTTLPVLEGTKPPVTFPAVEPENSFLNATMEELASFVTRKLRPLDRDVFPPDYLSETHFFILDTESLRDGSMTLVNMVDADYEDDDDSDVEDLDDQYESTQRLRLAGEKVGVPFGKKSLTKAYLFGEENGVEDNEEKREGKFKINLLRIGLGIGREWAETIERSSCDIDVLKAGCANDGVYWGPNFRGKDPPPMEERAAVKELEFQGNVDESGTLVEQI